MSSGITTFLPSCWRPCVGDCTHWLRAASLLRVGLSTETAATHAACSAILQAVSALTRAKIKTTFRLGYPEPTVYMLFERRRGV